MQDLHSFIEKLTMSETVISNCLLGTIKITNWRMNFTVSLALCDFIVFVLFVIMIWFNVNLNEVTTQFLNEWENWFSRNTISTGRWDDCSSFLHFTHHRMHLWVGYKLTAHHNRLLLKQQQSYMELYNHTSAIFNALKYCIIYKTYTCAKGWWSWW